MNQSPVQGGHDKIFTTEKPKPAIPFRGGSLAFFPAI